MLLHQHQSFVPYYNHCTFFVNFSWPCFWHRQWWRKHWMMPMRLMLFSITKKGEDKRNLLLVDLPSWVACNAVHHLKSFEPVLVPALDIISSPALVQTYQDHLIFFGNTHQLQLSLLLSKAEINIKLGLNLKAQPLLYGTICCLSWICKCALIVLPQSELTFFCHNNSSCQLLQLLPWCVISSP